MPRKNITAKEDELLNIGFSLYTNTAKNILNDMREKNPDYKANFPRLLMAALNEICAPEGKELLWACIDCGDTDCDCNGGEDDSEDESEIERVEINIES